MAAISVSGFATHRIAHVSNHHISVAAANLQHVHVHVIDA
jgi:hypothetical protein